MTEQRLHDKVQPQAGNLIAGEADQNLVNEHDAILLAPRTPSSPRGFKVSLSFHRVIVIEQRHTERAAQERASRSETSGFTQRSQNVPAAADAVIDTITFGQRPDQPGLDAPEEIIGIVTRNGR